MMPTRCFSGLSPVTATPARPPRRHGMKGALRYGRMREVLIATTNPGKLREIRGILREAPVALKTLGDFPGIEAPEETGSSFAENARQKAFYYARATGIPTLAEDSGFEV